MEKRGKGDSPSAVVVRRSGLGGGSSRSSSSSRSAMARGSGMGLAMGRGAGGRKKGAGDDGGRGSAMLGREGRVQGLAERMRERTTKWPLIFKIN